MGVFDDMLEKDRKIEDELYDYAPEEREHVLKDFHGRSKEEFGGVDFGKNTSSSNYYGTGSSDNSFASIVGFIVVVIVIFFLILH